MGARPAVARGGGAPVTGGYMLAWALLGGTLTWTAAILAGWLLNRRATRAEGAGPEPFNWRLLVNPGLYYEWVRRHGRRSGPPPDTP